MGFASFFFIVVVMLVVVYLLVNPNSESVIEGTAHQLDRRFQRFFTSSFFTSRIKVALGWLALIGYISQ